MKTALRAGNTQAKVSPPLRTAADREALRRAVKNGTIDILATDHAPHAAHEKEGTLDDAMCGFTGLDLAVSLTWGLVAEGVLTEADVHRLWSRRPAEIFNLPCNGFTPGDPADFFPNLTRRNMGSRAGKSIPKAATRHFWVRPCAAGLAPLIDGMQKFDIPGS